MLFIVPVSDLSDYDFQVAFWGEKEDEVRVLFCKEGRYFLFSGKDFKMFLDKLREKLGFQDLQSL